MDLDGRDYLGGRYGSAWGLEYVLLGLAAGASFALLLLDMDFFGSLFPEGHVEFQLAFLYKLSSLVTAVFCMFTGGLDLSVRLNIGLMMQAALAWSITWVSSFHALVACVLALGAAQAITQTSLFGLCCQSGTLAEAKLQRVFLGLGLSGVLSGALKCFTKAMDPALRGSAMKMGVSMAALSVAALCVTKTVGSKFRASTAAREPSEVFDHCRKVWPALLLLGSTLAVSMLVFPGVTTHIRPGMKWWGGWFHVVLYVGFLAFDVLGRLRVPVLPMKWLWGLCAARLAFLPCFVLLSQHESKYVDVLACVCVASLAATNGFLVTSAAQLAPGLSPGRELTGMLLCVGALVGQATGLCCAFALRPKPHGLSLIAETFGIPDVLL